VPATPTESLATCLTTNSRPGSAANQNPDILQCEEGEEEICGICKRQIPEVALWSLGQTPGWIQKEIVEKAACSKESPEATCVL